jgi:hypothetical protein
MFLTLILELVKEKSASCFCWLKMFIHNLFILKNHAHVHKSLHHHLSPSFVLSFRLIMHHPYWKCTLNNYHLRNSVPLPPHQTECGNRLRGDQGNQHIINSNVESNGSPASTTLKWCQGMKLLTTLSIWQNFPFGLLLNLLGSCVTNEFLSDRFLCYYLLASGHHFLSANFPSLDCILIKWFDHNFLSRR